ncbi:MAG: transposase [Deltaproteobacteria bacterium]|nr:transposase [Deltaproteobacteria bacterium]
MLKGLKRQCLDICVEVRFPRRIYKGKRTWVKRQFRIVGIYDEESQGYHLYITNIPADQLTAAQVAKTYAGRWIVELIFKQLKSYFQMDTLPSGKQEIVEALIYIALLTMAVSRTIQNLLEVDALHAQNPDEVERHFPLLRLAAVLRDMAHKLLEAVLKEAGVPIVERSLWDIIRNQAADPNRSRKLLLHRLQDI